MSSGPGDFLSESDRREIAALYRGHTERSRWWKRKYRIVRDRWAGYEFQVWRWWWPFWVMPYCNTHSTIETAEAAARIHAKGPVKHLGEL